MLILPDKCNNYHFKPWRNFILHGNSNTLLIYIFNGFLGSNLLADRQWKLEVSSINEYKL